MAQPEHAKKERIHAIKIGYLTDRLNLSTREAEGFWPVYNAYEREFMSVRKQYRKKYMDANNGHLSPGEAHRFIDEDIEYREKMLELRKKYKQQFLKVITATKLAELYQAEADFKEMLIRRLDHHREGDHHGRPARR